MATTLEDMGYRMTIESRGWWIRHHAQEIVAASRLVHSMPEWETRAEGEIKDAIKELTEALEILNGKQRGEGGPSDGGKTSRE